MYAPNSNGIIGDVARAASPEFAYRIGQHFKANQTLNQLDNGHRPEEQSANHLLAHAILGAAVSYATGNDITTGALSGAGSEVAAPALANYLYGTNEPSELNQDQKDTITSILNLATATAIYTAADGSTTDAVSGAEIGKVGVGNNNNGWMSVTSHNFGVTSYDVSLAQYCANQGGSFTECIDKKGSAVKKTDTSNQNLPLLFYIMPEHVTPFLDGNQRATAEIMKPIVKANRGVAVITGYAPYVVATAATQPAITANTALGATNNTILYYQTTKPSDRSAEKAAVYAIGGGLTGGVASPVRTVKGVMATNTAGYALTQGVAEGYVNTPTAVTAGVLGGAGKVLGNANCLTSCQSFTIIPTTNSLTTISDKAVDKTFEKRQDLNRPYGGGKFCLFGVDKKTGKCKP
ncbi:VENN motif pre-toxin domain-containing protein [Moraxella oculi]|uniref:VENN motif pre-toxin domain-containing protein n=1 Tax=Moraxella oculi TaxID=2940516 RepID=A0ABW8U8Z9_9GAMM